MKHISQNKLHQVIMKNVLITFILLISSISFSQENCNCGTIYGETFSFKLTAPSGWVLDNKSGVKQEIQAVFYKKGNTWSDAETVMYANTSPLKMPNQKTLADLMEYDAKRFQKNYPGIKISKENKIKINDKIFAIIKKFGSKSYGNYEAIAYIDAGKTGIMIVMSSRTKLGFERDYKQFVELIKSYDFIADYNITEKK